MRKSSVATVILILASAAASCYPRRHTSGDEGPGGSGLSAISLNLPTREKMPDFYGGAGCPDLKLKPEVLTTSDQCQEAANLLGEYRLKIVPAKCETGISGTNKLATGKSTNGKIEEKIVKGCSYDVLLEVGQISANKIYYSNSNAAKANLDAPKSAGTSLQLRIELMVTELGSQLGFPATETIISESDANLDIDIGIGNKKTPAPSGNPNPTGIVRLISATELFLKKTAAGLLDPTIVAAADQAILIKAQDGLAKYSSSPAQVSIDFAKHMIVG